MSLSHYITTKQLGILYGLTLCFCGLVLPVSISQAAVVVTPYFEDFESYTSDGATDFAESNSAAFIITNHNGNRTYRARIAQSSNASAAVQVAGAAGKDFTISSTLILDVRNPNDANGFNLTLAAAGSSSSFGTSEYRAGIDFLSGNVLLTRNGSNQTFDSTSGNQPPFSLDIGTTYTVSISGTYNTPTNVTLTVTVSDGTKTFSGTWTDTNALSGDYFGYRIAKNGTNNELAVFLDNFALNVVPEPSRCLLSLSALSLLILRRKRF